METTRSIIGISLVKHDGAAELPFITTQSIHREYKYKYTQWAVFWEWDWLSLRNHVFVTLRHQCEPLFRKPRAPTVVQCNVLHQSIKCLSRGWPRAIRLCQVCFISYSVVYCMYIGQKAVKRWEHDLQLGRKKKISPTTRRPKEVSAYSHKMSFDNPGNCTCAKKFAVRRQHCDLGTTSSSRLGQVVLTVVVCRRLIGRNRST